VFQHFSQNGLLADARLRKAEFLCRRFGVAQRRARRQAGGGKEAQKLRLRPAVLEIFKDNVPLASMMASTLREVPQSGL